MSESTKLCVDTAWDALHIGMVVDHIQQSLGAV